MLTVTAAKMSDVHMIQCAACYADTEYNSIKPTCEFCGEPWENSILTRSYTRETAAQVVDPAMKKRVMALQDIWYAEQKIQMIAAGGVLGTRQKLYDMYMNGQLRLTRRSQRLREQLEPRDYELFDEIGALYEQIADAKAQLS